tara:strand:- start:421 stop:1101 length:681 start_codon:yes stop_codon:yes gene_type:complete
MKIILTNDDGFDHLGIKALFMELNKKHEVFLIGPDQNRSGFSSAITFLTPLKHKKYADNIYSLNGTPVDCVKVARNLLCPFEPDIVVSGINPGPNLGSDAILSGTVGAALDGRDLKYPSISVSVASFEINDFSFAAKFVAKVLDNLEALKIENFHILNINVPDHNQFPDPQVKITKTFLNEFEAEKNLEESDRKNLDDGFISVSPIKIDMHTSSELESVEAWSKNL